MTRNEYIGRLAEALNFLGEDARAAALSFYTEMLDDRIEDGMDEQSAVAAMEDPADIAARLHDEKAGIEEGKKHHSIQDDAMEFSSLADAVMRIQKAVVGIGRSAVDDGADGTAEGARDGQSEAAAREEALKDAQKIRLEAIRTREKAQRARAEAMETAAKAREEAHRAREEALETAAKARAEERQAREARKADETTAEEQAGDYEARHFSCPIAGLRAVRLLASDMPIIVNPCPGDKLNLTYYSSEWDPYTVQVQDGVLTLDHSGGKANRRGFRFSFSVNNVVRVLWNHSSPTIELSLPADALVDLQAITGNGSIRLQGMNALCDTVLHTTNCRIALENVTCKSLEMKTSNGRLALENVRTKRFFRGKTSNARIEAQKLHSGEELSLGTSNGRLNAEECSAQQKMNLYTSNGSITVNRLSAPDLALRTCNSSIRGVLPGCQADWAIDSGTSNGRNSLPKHQEGSKPLLVYTSNGSIELTFEG